MARAMDSAYRFRPVAEADLPLLREWRSRPHWVQWWGAAEGDEGFFEEAMADPHTRTWIVELDGRAFAYAQDYDPHAWPGHPFAHLPPGARGIDQSIGDPELLCRGHGSAFVRSHVERLFAEGAPAVGTDPHPDNKRAIRAYEKAGFAICGGPVDSPWGRCLLMEQWRDPEPMTAHRGASGIHQSLAQVALIVRDYDEAIAWFTGKLNFTLVADEHQPGQDKRWVLVAPPGAPAGSASILLARAASPEQERLVGNQAGGRVFLFLATDDFDRDHRAMRSKGVSFVREPRRETYGTVAVFEDLYGNLWDLIQFAAGDFAATPDAPPGEVATHRHRA